MQISPFLSRIFIRQPCNQFQRLICRTIYSAEQLSLEKYAKDRRRLKMNMSSTSIEMNKSNLRKYLRQSNVSSWVLINELTQFLHLIENSDDDFVLLEQALDKFKHFNTDNLRKGNIGSILMKVMHYFRRDESAQKIYSDKILKQNFLSGRHSNLIFFDLLYKQRKYADLLRHFDELKEDLLSEEKLISRSIFILAFATCYAQNTAASFKYATQLHEQFSESHITRDHLIFLSALALHQNAPDVATKYLSYLWPTTHVAINSLRISALLRMRRFVDSLQIIRSILMACDNNQTPKADVIAFDVMEEAEAVFKQFCEDERLRNEFQHLQVNLNAHGYVVEKNVADLIFEPFESTQMTRHQKNRMFLQAAFYQKNVKS